MAERGIDYDRGVDAAYIQFRAAPHSRGKDLGDSRRIEYGEDPRPTGIALLNRSLGVRLENLPDAGKVRRLIEESYITVHT